MKLIVLLSTLLASLNAFAVPVKDCPKNLTVKYADVKVERTLQYVIENSNLSEKNGDEKEIASLAKAFNNLGTSPTKFSLPLREAKNGRCEYSTKGNRYNQRIQIYSSKGRSIAMIDNGTMGERGELARVYGTILKFSPDGLEMSANSGLALAIPRTPYTDYSAGGDLVFIGKVRDLALTIE